MTDTSSDKSDKSARVDVTSLLSMPQFDGKGSLSRFLDDYDRYARIQGWDDERKLDVLPLTLSGIARDAFEGIPASQLQLHSHSKLSDQLCSILSHTHTAAPRTTSSVRMPRGGPTPAGAGSAGLPPRGRQPAAQRPGGKTDRRPPQPAAAGGGRRAAGGGRRGRGAAPATPDAPKKKKTVLSQAAASHTCGVPEVKKPAQAGVISTQFEMLTE